LARTYFSFCSDTTHKHTNSNAYHIAPILINKGFNTIFELQFPIEHIQSESKPIRSPKFELKNPFKKRKKEKKKGTEQKINSDEIKFETYPKYFNHGTNFQTNLLPHVELKKPYKGNENRDTYSN
jgi:hypothetical protein